MLNHVLITCCSPPAYGRYIHIQTFIVKVGSFMRRDAVTSRNNPLELCHLTITFCYKARKSSEKDECGV